MSATHEHSNQRVPIRANRILAALTNEEFESIQSDLHREYLDIKAPMVKANEPITIIDFPLHGLASQVATMRDGFTVEVGPIGREGSTGLPLFLGTTTTPIDTFMQIPGESMRMSAHAFRTAVDQLPSLRRAMQLYAEATVTSMAWWVACNRAHLIEQRFARWLLMCHDRVLIDEFPLTQEFIAQMMGIRRASVSEVAGQFQAAGYITYTRGQMRIVDRRGLELRTCECYWIVTREWDGLLGSDYLAKSTGAGEAGEHYRD